MRAIQLSVYGNPVDGLSIADVPEPKAPGANEVLVAIEYSPINPNDLLVARGVYPLRPELPSVIGNEGVGRVLAVGSGVTNVAVGDRVVPPRSSWVWRERMVVPARGLFALPRGADPKQLAMLAINPPTASLLLSDYVDLNRGDFVVQNAANSGVGRWVIAFAKTRGLRTVNIVRRAELVTDLQAVGGDVVVVDGPEVTEEIKKAVGSGRIRLALDGVSGPATGVLGAVLAPGGTLVAYSAMSGAPMVLDPLAVIFTPITVKGFFMGHAQMGGQDPGGDRGSGDAGRRGSQGPDRGGLPPLRDQESRRAHPPRWQGASRRRRRVMRALETSSSRQPSGSMSTAIVPSA
jgi:NADPH:quinone reductase-like Zn-dependent oxidoreductase